MAKQDSKASKARVILYSYVEEYIKSSLSRGEKVSEEMITVGRVR
jgi:hypothetical protein